MDIFVINIVYLHFLSTISNRREETYERRKKNDFRMVNADSAIVIQKSTEIYSKFFFFLFYEHRHKELILSIRQKGIQLIIR